MATQAEGPEEGRVWDSQSRVLLTKYTPWGRKKQVMRQVRKKSLRRTLEMSSGTMVMNFQLGGKPAWQSLSCRVYNLRVVEVWETLSP